MKDSSEVIWYITGQISVQYWNNDVCKPGVNICQIKHGLIHLLIIADVFVRRCELGQGPV